MCCCHLYQGLKFFYVVIQSRIIMLSKVIYLMPYDSLLIFLLSSNQDICFKCHSFSGPRCLSSANCIIYIYSKLLILLLLAAFNVCLLCVELRVFPVDGIILKIIHVNKRIGRFSSKYILQEHSNHNETDFITFRM